MPSTLHFSCAATGLSTAHCIPCTGPVVSHYDAITAHCTPCTEPVCITEGTTLHSLIGSGVVTADDDVTTAHCDSTDPVHIDVDASTAHCLTDTEPVCITEGMTTAHSLTGSDPVHAEKSAAMTHCLNDTDLMRSTSTGATTTHCDISTELVRTLTSMTTAHSHTDSDSVHANTVVTTAHCDSTDPVHDTLKSTDVTTAHCLDTEPVHIDVDALTAHCPIRTDSVCTDETVTTDHCDDTDSVHRNLTDATTAHCLTDTEPVCTDTDAITTHSLKYSDVVRTGLITDATTAHCLTDTDPVCTLSVLQQIQSAVYTHATTHSPLDSESVHVALQPDITPLIDMYDALTSHANVTDITLNNHDLFHGVHGDMQDLDAWHVVKSTDMHTTHSPRMSDTDTQVLSMHNRFAVLAEDLTDDDTDNTDDTIIHLLSAPKQVRSTHCSKSRVKTHTNTRVRSKKSKKGQDMVSKPTPTPTVEETPTLDVLQQLQFAVHTHTMDPTAPLRARKRPEDPQDKAVSKCSDLLSCLGVAFMVGDIRVNKYGRRQRQRRIQLAAGFHLKILRLHAVVDAVVRFENVEQETARGHVRVRLRRLHRRRKIRHGLRVDGVVERVHHHFGVALERDAVRGRRGGLYPGLLVVVLGPRHLVLIEFDRELHVVLLELLQRLLAVHRASHGHCAFGREQLRLRERRASDCARRVHPLN